MRKHIDAERLKNELKKRIELLENGDAHPEVMKRVEGTIEGYRAALSIIASLQQEQPEPPGYDKALLEVKRMVDKLYDEASIGLSEYDSGLYNGIAETCTKLRGFIKARLDSDEQPEVDLEKEYETWWNSISGKINIEHIMEWYMHETARHFYELGLIAKNQ